MTVFVSVVLAGFFGMKNSVDMVAVGDVRVMARALMIPRFVAFGGCSMMLGSVFVVLGSFAMMLGGLHGHG